MYVFKWSKYEDHSPNSLGEINFQKYFSLKFFVPQGKIPYVFFHAQFKKFTENFTENFT